MMDLESIARKELDIDDWRDSAKLVKRVLTRLNNLHRDALQRALGFEAQIREVGGEPDVKVVVTWPEPEPKPVPSQA